jgi:hypothetical protein
MCLGNLMRGAGLGKAVHALWRAAILGQGLAHRFHGHRRIHLTDFSRYMTFGMIGIGIPGRIGCGNIN